MSLLLLLSMVEGILSEGKEVVLSPCGELDCDSCMGVVFLLLNHDCDVDNLRVLSWSVNGLLRGMPFDFESGSEKKHVVMAGGG